MSHINCSRVIPAKPSEVFRFACNPENLKSLLVDTIEVETIAPIAELAANVEYGLQMTRFHSTQKIRIRVTEFKADQWLTYKQTEGLYKRWIHSQRFEPHGTQSTLITDLVEYELPFGLIGYLLDDLILRQDMQNVLEKRLQRLEEIFSARASVNADHLAPD